jgi:hypothetical protein
MTTTASRGPRALSIGGETIRILPHAQERYHLRVQAAQPFAGAVANLVLIAELHGEVRSDAPAWRHRDPQAVTDSTAAWLWLGPDIALPLVYSGHELVATTTLVRGGISDHIRARRKLKRARRRERARMGFHARPGVFQDAQTRRFDAYEPMAEAA